MSQDTSEQIQVIKKKVGLLIRKYQKLVKEKASLVEEKTELVNLLEEKNIYIEELENNVNLLKVSGCLGGSAKEDNRDVRETLDKYIDEIDRCIAVLQR